MARRAAQLPAIVAALALAACGRAIDLPAEHAPTPPARPQRVVSLDYCADQYVLKLLDREQILAVSPDAGAEFSYMAASAAGLARVRPLAEDVMILKPDLVVRSYGGGPGAEDFFVRAGVPVLQVGFADDIAGVRRVLIDMAEGLGQRTRGEALAASIDARLAHVAAQKNPAATALYVTPTGVTAGPGTLIDHMLSAASLANFEREPGWRSLPLERLAYERPDLVATAFFDQRRNHEGAWAASRHPVARRQTADRPVVALEGAWTACGGWFLVDAIEALAAPALETAAAK